MQLNELSLDKLAATNQNKLGSAAVTTLKSKYNPKLSNLSNIDDIYFFLQ